MMKFLLTLFKSISELWAELNGDGTYQRYLAHWTTHHASSEHKPLSRKAYFAQELERKWKGVKRCC